MNSHEVFYLHIQGEQRGPYTVRHIDHLLNSGLIDEDAMFWREGLEQWQPVTQLVARRMPEERWRISRIWVAVAVVLALLLWVFGPITVEGWRETNEREFSNWSAYWRAREAVRSQKVPPGAFVEFEDFAKAKAELVGTDRANVLLRARLTDRNGQTRETAWSVELKHDRAAMEWSGVSANEIAPP